MNPLISRQQLETYRDIGKSIPDNRIDAAIHEAQRHDIGELVGRKFVQAMEDVAGGATNNPGLTPAAWTTIQPLLTAPLAYFALSRLARELPSNFTSFGMVQKETPFSMPLESRELQVQHLRLREIALAEMEDLLEVIETNETDYPLYDPPQEPSMGVDIDGL